MSSYSVCPPAGAGQPSSPTDPIRPGPECACEGAGAGVGEAAGDGLADAAVGEDTAAGWFEHAADASSRAASAPTLIGRRE